MLFRSEHVERAAGTVIGTVFRRIAYVSPKTSVPSGATIFVGAAAIAALLFFGSFSRIVSFVLVPLQALSMLMISTVFILRPRLASADTYRTPGYPWIPLTYIVVVGILLVSAIIYNPMESLLGLAFTFAAVPCYYFLNRNHVPE